MSSIQSEQDGMLEKVKRNQSEILLINRNIAANLKKLRQDQVDIGQTANVNQQLIVHMLDQAVAMEQTIQTHLNNCDNSKGGKFNNLNNISVNFGQGTS